MKFLALLFLLGVATAAPFYDELGDTADEIAREFKELSPSFLSALADDDAEEEIKTELGKKLKEAFDHILEKVRDALDHGKTVKEELLDKLKEIRQKLKDLHIDVGNKAKELLEKIKERAKDFLRKLLEKLGLDKDKEERSLDDDDVILHASSLKEFFKKIKDAILQKIDKEALKAKIEQLFGKYHEIAEKLIDILKEKGEQGKKKLLDFIDRVLGEDEDKVEERSLSEWWEKIKYFFHNLGFEIKVKYSKFGEWLRQVWGEKVEKGRSKLENLKEIVKEFNKHAKDVSKEVAAEFLEFMRQYKDDLGNLWEQAKDSVKDVLNRKD